MSGRLPPFKSIEAFVAAGRARSLTAAAATLNITVPAVSRRIQALEAELGVQLFHRSARRLALTRAGETYMLRLVPAIDAIRGASERIRSESRHNSVKISLPPSFAAAWLVPRLPKFDAQYRDIQIDLRSWVGYVNFDDMDVDLAIQLGNGDWPSLHAERLFDVEAFPVCSMALLASGRSLRAPSDLPNFPLMAFSDEPDLWPEWFRAHGIGDPPRTRHTFDQLHLLYQAAASGLGVALGFDVTARLYLDDDRLVRPLDASVKLPKGYYIIRPPDEMVRRPVAAFRKWLVAEAAAWRAQISSSSYSPERRLSGGASRR